jgi:ATP-dependent DNA helicase RecG
MTATLEELHVWLSEPEGERLEFKEAKANFHFETLTKYCAALANEGGGKIILGVTDRRPRRVVGSTAFEEPGRTVAGLINRLGIQIRAEEILHHHNFLAAIGASFPSLLCSRTTVHLQAVFY